MGIFTSAPTAPDPLQFHNNVFVVDVPKGFEVEDVVVNADGENGDYVYITVRDKPVPPPVTVATLRVRD